MLPNASSSHVSKQLSPGDGRQVMKYFLYVTYALQPDLGQPKQFQILFSLEGSAHQTPERVSRRPP